MPMATPLGVTYLKGETLWGVERPVLETQTGHTWQMTGIARQSGDVDMLEWIVAEDPAIVAAKSRKNAAVALTAVGLLVGAVWLLGR